MTRAIVRPEPDRPAATAETWLRYGLSILLVLAVLAVYAPGRLGEFVNYDDPDYVTENPHVASGLSLENLRWAMTTGHAANWHPLTWVPHLRLMAKPMVVTLPLVLLLLDAWPLGRLRAWRDLPALVREKVPLVALSALAGAFTFSAQHRAGAVAELDRLGAGPRAANALVATARYLQLTAWLAGAALGAISLLVVRVAHRHPAVAVGWLWGLPLRRPPTTPTGHHAER